MKLIYHHRTQGRGAEGAHVFGVIHAFRELGHSVEIICPPGVPANDTTQNASGNAATAGRSWSSQLWQIVSSQAPEWIFESLELLYSGYSYVRLFVAAIRLRPDVIYDRYSLFNLGPALVSRQLRIPLITEVNDATVIERSRQLFFKGLARRVEKAIMTRSTVVVTVSNNFRDRISVSHGISKSSIVVTPNAVDPRRFSNSLGDIVRERLSLQGKCVIGVVGGFVPWHGLDFLVKAVADLLRKRIEVSVLLVGDGPVRPAIEELVRTLALSDRIHFTGFVSLNDVPEFIAAMDICLMPDSNTHGSPIKIFEYMAMGKAIVAPSYEPISDVIEHGVNGLLFRPKDSNELAATIYLLVNDPIQRERIGNNARQCVMARHTWRSNVEAALAALSK